MDRANHIYPERSNRLFAYSRHRNQRGSAQPTENLRRSSTEAAILLKHLLGDWIDFAFIPSSPREFVLYADHDQYTTVFTPTTDLFTALHRAMKNEGFQEVKDWTWTGPHTPGTEGMSIDV